MLFLVGPAPVASLATLILIPGFLLRRRGLVGAARPGQSDTTVIPAQVAPYVLGGFTVTLTAVVLWIMVQAFTQGP